MVEERRARIRRQQQMKRQQTMRMLAIVAVGLLVILVLSAVALHVKPAEQPVEDASAVQMEAPEQNGDVVQESPEMQIPVLPEEESWKVRLVNNNSMLEEGYVPELVQVDGTGFLFDARAAEDLNAMLADARIEGFSPMICSSYRPWERQTALFEKQVEKQQATGLTYEEAWEAAKTVVAYPGTSEHQTGLAADIVATSHQLLDDSQAETPDQQWLMANSWKYGFILRYPLGKSEYTAIIYEPWHYRYVGKEVAQYITENNLCLEEYWQQLEALQNPQPEEGAQQ